MRYLIQNGHMPTTAVLAKVATGTGLKTMLQVAPLVPMYVIEWGWSGDASAAATPGQVELIETGAVAATVTACVAADVVAQDGEALLLNSPATFFTLGTAATGFTASAEGTITASRPIAGAQQIASTTQFFQQWGEGTRPLIQANDFLRIRNIFGTSVNAYCYVVLGVGCP